jgi:3-deoxy-D-manno-octulosonic-acid transferase
MSFLSLFFGQWLWDKRWMWQPISRLEYMKLEPTAQALVVACPFKVAMPEIRKRWASHAVAWIGDSSMFVRDVVRDLLANPQVRVIVFHGAACGRAAYDAFWRSHDDPGWGIPLDHLTLVRQFVDLYDDDFVIKAPMAPFWPERLRYLDKETM